jgi:chitinase
MKYVSIGLFLLLCSCSIIDTDSDDTGSEDKSSVPSSSESQSSDDKSSVQTTNSSENNISSEESSSSEENTSSAVGNGETELRSVTTDDINPVNLPADPDYAALGDLKLSTFMNSSKFGKIASGLRHIHDCPAADFYKYDDFMEAVESFPRFGTEGDDETRIREVMAFFANISHETTGGYAAQSDVEKYAMGLCFKDEVGCETGCPQYTAWSSDWEPNESKEYYGRGPMQLSWNYNYGQAGDDLGIDLINNPELVSSDGVVAFKTALWFWMKPQYPKPSAHDVMVGAWKYTDNDVKYNREKGFGVTINLINGGMECGSGRPNKTGSLDRIGFYKNYLSAYKLEPLYPEKLDCEDQTDFRKI